MRTDTNGAYELFVAATGCARRVAQSMTKAYPRYRCGRLTPNNAPTLFVKPKPTSRLTGFLQSFYSSLKSCVLLRRIVSA